VKKLKHYSPSPETLLMTIVCWNLTGNLKFSGIYCKTSDYCQTTNTQNSLKNESWRNNYLFLQMLHGKEISLCTQPYSDVMIMYILSLQHMKNLDSVAQHNFLSNVLIHTAF